jgi:hypothetical protein
MPSLVALSELDAVNGMLISIGQAPVNTLTGTGIRDVSIAASVLHQTSREVQTRGWDFNVDTDFELTPNVEDQIVVPTNVLHLVVQRPHPNITVRDNGGTAMLWDLDKKTWEFTSPVRARVVWFFGFETIPQYARNYIGTKAARRFQAYSVGSQILYQYTLDDETDAYAELVRNCTRSKNVNILNTGDFTDQIFQRRRTIPRY